MARTLPRADFVQSDPTGHVLYAIYPPEVSRNDVRSVAAQLSALRGVTARATQGALDDPSSPPVTVVEVTLGSAADRTYALWLAKRLTNPQLPIGIYELRFGVLICKCNYISSTVDGVRFIQGFEPDDTEAFQLRFYAALRRQPIAWLFGSEPTPPYAALSGALEVVLAELGARSTILGVAPRRDPRPCKHPKG